MSEAATHRPEDLEALLADGVMSIDAYCVEFDSSRAQCYRDMSAGLLPFVMHGRRRKIPRVGARRMFAARLNAGAQGLPG